MDHLPAPRDAGKPIRVPYLDVIPYDLVNDLPLDAALDHFQQFPDRREFGHQGTIARDLDPAKLATVVQSWLYFGLISAFFNTHIDLTDFATTSPPNDPPRNPSPVYVTSAHLNKLLKALDRTEREARDKERDAYSEERGETDRNRKEVLREHRKALSASRAKRRKFRDDLCVYSRDIVVSLDEADIERSPDLAAICLSIQLLTITLLGCNPTEDPSIGWRDNDDDSSIEREDRLSVSLCWKWLLSFGRAYANFSYTQQLKRLVLKTRALFGSHSAPPPATRNIHYPAFFLDPSHCASKLLQSTMVRNGWCRSNLDYIFTSQDFLTIYYLSQIRRPPVLSLSHDQCTREECFAINSPSRPPYHRSHSTDTCQCVDIHVNTESLCRIIEDGDIPLVYVEPAGHGTFCLKLTRMSSLSEYVSISHVWSDGLGNADANSLFQCELESIMDSFPHIPRDRYTRLRSFKRQLQMVLEHLLSTFVSCEEPVFRKQLFWMDTLCIPVASASNTPDEVARINALKQRAINHMNMVYYGATHVIILDAQLRKVSLTGAPKCEIAARIAFSHWNSRCWTLQEGALGSAWLVKFSDGLLGGSRFRASVQRLDKGNSRIRNHMLEYLEEPETIFEADELSRALPRAECSVEEHIRNGLVARLKGPLQLFSDSDGVFQRDEGFLTLEAQAERDVISFSAIWNQLSWRSTSEEKDVPGIFATLLNFNLHQLVQYFPGEEMLMGLLWNLQGVPLTLLFNQGPRLKAGKNHKNRWAPTKRHAIACVDRTSMTLKGTNFHFTDKSAGNCRLAIFVWPQGVSSNEFVAQTPMGSVHVTLFKTADDEMPAEAGARYAILLDGDVRNTETESEEDTGPMRGAILRVHEYIPIDHEDTDEQRKDYPKNGLRISAIFDCPAELHLYQSQIAPRDMPVVALDAELLEKDRDWEVFLQADSSQTKSLCLARRRDFAKFRMFQNIMKLVWTWLWVVNFVIRTTISYRSHPLTLQPLGQAAAFIWCCQIGIRAMFLPPALAKILFIIDRTRNGGLTSLDWAYILIPFDFWLVEISLGVAELLDAHIGWNLNMSFYSENFVKPTRVKGGVTMLIIEIIINLEKEPSFNKFWGWLSRFEWIR